jgi:hypothetical protein
MTAVSAIGIGTERSATFDQSETCNGKGFWQRVTA